MYLFNYACQETCPSTCYEGYKTFTANNKYPYLGDDFDPLADMLFGAACPLSHNRAITGRCRW